MKTLQFALAGNPNVGKSTLFNRLTGLRQHTGNWAGKTVEIAQGTFTWQGHAITLTDLPGTYSLHTHSPEEEAAETFLRTGYIDGVIVVCDGCLLSRHLILVLQLLEKGWPLLLCVNLLDEAEKRGISVDTEKLSACLGVPVFPCSARHGEGVDALCDAMLHLSNESRLPSETKEKSEAPSLLEYGTDIPAQAQTIAGLVTCKSTEKSTRNLWETRLDRLFTGPMTAYPIMALLVLMVFWLTITGAGYLSSGLEILFGTILRTIDTWFGHLAVYGFPLWLHSFITEGILTTVAQVVAVMLPPMAVFFPLFTLLEDFGYLPRAAFSLDRLFCGCGACGKQALTMLMGLGCNAAGVTGCRIIDAPCERKMAILTNVLIPCNGRLPMVLLTVGMIATSTTGSGTGMRAVGMVLVLLVCSVVTLLLCRILHHTLLRDQPSSFTLEMPNYRIPQFGQVIVRSVIDRTLVVLGRAVMIAAPAGGVLWLLNHISLQGMTLFQHFFSFLDPIGRFFGMDGVILAGFILSLPAAELFLPLVLSGYSMLSPVAIMGTEEILLTHGWTGVTVLCVLCFTLFHWPCATTIWTIRKETGSIKWTAAGVFFPTMTGLILCALLRWGGVLLGM